jgi:hypothetical protein
VLDRNFRKDKVEGEIAYLQQKSRGTFERTYGWAWLLKPIRRRKVRSSRHSFDASLEVARSDARHEQSRRTSA